MFGAILGYFGKYFEKNKCFNQFLLRKVCLRRHNFVFFTILGYFRKYFEKIVKKNENLASFMLDRPTQVDFSYF